MTANNDELRMRLAELSAQNDIPEQARKELRELSGQIKNPLQTDVWIYRIVVLFLGAVILITVLGGILLAWRGGNTPNWELPQGIVAIGSAAVGALAGLLAPSPRSD